MPVAVRVVLNDEEDRTLSELRLATHVPQRTRDRAHIVRLNAQGWTVLRAGTSYLQQPTIGTEAGAGTAGEVEC